MPRSLKAKYNRQWTNINTEYMIEKRTIRKLEEYLRELKRNGQPIKSQFKNYVT